MDNANTWAKDIIGAAMASQAQPIAPPADADTFIVATHKDMVVQSLEEHLPAPLRIREQVYITEATSFIDYWQRFASDSSVIFADLNQRRFRAVFDYHEPQRPKWCEHGATLICDHSTEWKTWSASNAKSMEQSSFAEFIEANAIDIVQPAAAEMIQIALTLQAKTKVDFASGIRLDNGQVQLTYQEKIEGSAGPKGELKIPEKFTLALRIFQGGDKYQVEAYLRYRIKEGKATFFYQIIRPERLIEDAFEQVKKQVETGCTGAAIFATA